jgi:hypothetical protein
LHTGSAEQPQLNSGVTVFDPINADAWQDEVLATKTQIALKQAALEVVR